MSSLSGVCNLKSETKDKYNAFINSLFDDAGFPNLKEITDNEFYIVGYDE